MSKRLKNDPLEFIKDSRKSKEPAQRVEVKKSKVGLPEGWDRKTIIIRDDYIDKLETLAFLDRRTLKDVIDEALTEYLQDKKIPAREDYKR
jgi:hypothetical protein